MALPFVGVGLLYRHGYFRQAIDADGHQEHAYPDYDPATPAARCGSVDVDGDPIRVRSSCPGAPSRPPVWLAQVGRVPLLLLDTDIPDNERRRPAASPTMLYVRGREMRLHQEIVLGVGGVRALRALGIEPAGLAPQRGPLGVHARRARPRADGDRPRTQEAALEQVRRDAVFTIHTPVSAGNERFDAGPRAPARRAAGRGQRPGPRSASSSSAAAWTATTAAST